MRLAYHLTSAEWLADSLAAGGNSFLPEAFERDGFVHLTHGIQGVLDAGNRYYRDDAREYVLLTVDLALVGAEVLYEDSAERFPHIYGSIERAAISDVHRVQRAPDGTFLSVGGSVLHLLGTSDNEEAGR